jgi:MFS family permease
VQTGNWRLRDYIDLALITITHGLSDGFASLLVPVLALIVVDLGLSTFEAGMILSARSVAGLLFVYPLSMIADSTGRRKEMLLVGMALATLLFLAMPLINSLPLLLMVAFGVGAGNAVYHPCGTALVARRFDEQRAISLAFHGMGGNIGTSLMPLAQSAVVAIATWRAAVAVCALPAVLLLPAVGLRFPPTDVAAAPRLRMKETVRSLTGAVLRNRGVVLLGIIYALEAMGSKGMIGFLPLIAAQRFGWDTAAIALAISVYYTSGIVAKPLMGLLYNRWGARLALSVPLLLTGLCALALGLTPWMSSLIPLAAVLGVVSPISPILLTATAELSDKETLASSVGYIYTCNGLGFLSPLIGGWLGQRFGLPVGYVFFALIIIAGAVVATSLPGATPATRERSVVLS